MFASINAEYENASYPIIISANSLSSLEIYLSEIKKKNIFLIIDSKFKDTNFHPSKTLTKIINNYNKIFISGGIKSKSLNQLTKILFHLSEKNITRDSHIVAIGGGVIGDIVGLAASIYLRGAKLIHVPTSTTAMLDSSIGGKTGINIFDKVNMIGTYYHPEMVFIDTRFLNTLNKRDFRAGVAESIKKSIISDSSFFDFLNRNSEKINNLEFESTFNLIKRSLEIKLMHTRQDIYEKAKRLFLNYGHTFGQSLESYYGINQKSLRHGESVSLGCICASHMACSLNKKIDKIIISKHKSIFNKYKLPVHIKEVKNLKKPNVNKLFNLINNDKKKIISGNRFILCEKIGEAKIVTTSNKKLIINSFNEILE